MLTRGFLLAGGRSRRFGSPKARHPIAGEPMALLMASRFSELGLCCTLVCRDRSLEDLGLPLLVDSEGAHHPLQGLRAALRSLLPQEEALVAACDLPALPSEGLQRMLSGVGPAVASSDRSPHALLLRCDRQLLPQLETCLAREGSLRSLIRGWRRVHLPEEWLMNLNRPPRLDPP